MPDAPILPTTRSHSLPYSTRQRSIPLQLLPNNLTSYGNARYYSSDVRSYNQKNDSSGLSTDSTTAEESSSIKVKTTGDSVKSGETQDSTNDTRSEYGFQSLAGLLSSQSSLRGPPQIKQTDGEPEAAEIHFADQRDTTSRDGETGLRKSQGPRSFSRVPRNMQNEEEDGLLDLLPPSHRQSFAPRSRNDHVLKPSWKTMLIPNHQSEDLDSNSRDHKSSSASERAPPFNEGIPSLTHVNQAGEARMVNVGGKPYTKRAAIAVASVIFSNPAVHRLLLDNSTRKGDVLGTARVAGLMAAKRTSDLIPLCHPVQLSKVTLDLGLHAPRADAASYKSHGGVRIMAQVECFGPTGVEMEALTAAMISATTVFDMCKALDREMTIHGARVVYKSGGKSGLHVNKNWARARTPDFFSERGLTPPE